VKVDLVTQENIEMREKKQYKYIVFLLLSLVLLSSCGKKLVPSLNSGRPVKNKSYDAATFNYIYVEALKQKLMGNSGEALGYLEQAIKINPGSDAAYYQMAQILLGNNDIENGKKYAAKALSIDRENVWYLMMMASVSYQEKKLDSVIYYYETALKHYPEKENLQVTLGKLYTENRNYDKANQIFESLDKKYGVNETTAISSINSLMSAGNFEEALIKIKQLIEDKPDDVTYNSILAEVYRAMGENGKALEVYKVLIDKDPDDPQTQLSLTDFLIKEKFYEELFLLLNNIILSNTIKKEDKLTLFGRLIETPDIVNNQSDKLILAIMVLEANYKEDEIIPMLHPELLIRQNKLKESAVLLDGIIKKYPENYYAWEKLLIVYLQLGDYKNLMIRGGEAATLFNRSFLAKVLYANGAIESGEYLIALEELRKAEILAGDDNSLLMQVLTMRADVHYRTEDYIRAFEIFQQALEMDPEDLTVLNNYAYYLAEQGMRLKDAEEMARKVIEIEKDNTTFLDTYAWILYKRGKVKEAAGIMEIIVNSGEKPHADWFEHYGYILKKQKKCGNAIEKWNTAMQLDLNKTHLLREIENCRR
jgi:Tfp pilus assembly protein PilF